ncbi:3-oxoacyl-[acyl-carrier-protein] reductase [candidate division KSB1 bacterium]|nr:3-oxoacyl-[acyl-carrier-protein] reductase [candidate division KSB1 bacterium]
MVLKDKVALITGGARGIGKEIALELARRGADIVICDLIEEVSATAKEIEKLGVTAVGYVADITNKTDVDQLMTNILAKFSRLDILVNNAGITRDNLLIRMSDEEWDSVIAVNLKGTFNCLRAAAKIMIKQRSGKIINVASVVGMMGNMGQANYAASKGGVISLTKSAAKELASRGVTVNAVAPGYIETKMTEVLSDKVKEMFETLIPMKRAGTANDVARVVSFLASADADYVTGQVIKVDGGMLM